MHVLLQSSLQSELCVCGIIIIVHILCLRIRCVCICDIHERHTQQIKNEPLSCTLRTTPTTAAGRVNKMHARARAHGS